MGATRRQGSIVMVTPPSSVTDAGIDGILGELRGHLNSATPYALVFDMTDAGVPSALQRRKLADHMKNHAAKIQRLVRGLGVIAPSPVLRGVITALFWVAQPGMPHRIFATRDEALTWAAAIVGAGQASAPRPS
jgi:hypothetical protein